MKIRSQAKIDNFAFKNSNIIEGYFGREKINFHEKDLKYRKIILFLPQLFFLSLLTKFLKIMRF